MSLRFLFAALAFFTVSANAQINQRTAGLKTGVWKEKFTAGRGRMIADGSYVIIPADSFPVIRKLDKTSWEVKYLGSTPLLWLSGEIMGKISVKNGLWVYHDDKGNLLEESSFNCGLENWSKTYDSKGKIVKRSYRDFENDTSFYLDYRDGFLYRKSLYPPGDHGIRQDIYYPENNLSVSNAEPSFQIRFDKKKADTVEVLVTAKKEMLIQSVSSSQSSINYLAADGLPFPRTISPTTPLKFKLISHPTPASFCLYDTLLLRTPEEPNLYKIYCEIHAAHLYSSNLNKVKSLKLSRSRDQFLLIEFSGTDSGAFLLQDKNLLRSYSLNGVTKIDLSEFATGTYDLDVMTCGVSGLVKLVITD